TARHTMVTKMIAIAASSRLEPYTFCTRAIPASFGENPEIPHCAGKNHKHSNNRSINAEPGVCVSRFKLFVVAVCSVTIVALAACGGGAAGPSLPSKLPSPSPAPKPTATLDPPSFTFYQLP